MGGTARKVDTSAADFDENQQIEDLQKQRVDVKNRRPATDPCSGSSSVAN